MREGPRARARALRSRGPVVSAGLLAGDLMGLGRELRRLEKSPAAMVHLDLADGHFCPLFMGGPELVRAVETTLPRDVHMMVADPLALLPAVVDAGAELITTHVEATPHPHRVLRAMATTNGPSGAPPMRGVALNPGTPIAAVDPLLDELELVLLLAVDPGWPGLADPDATVGRVRALGERVAATGRDDLLVAVDGGITPERATPLVDAGADVVVAGSAVLRADDPSAAIAALLSREQP